MPGTDEDVMRGLLSAATGDLFASPAATAAALKGQRRHQMRRRLAGAAGTAAAAGVAAGVIVATSSSGGAVPATSVKTSTAPALRLSAAQRTLFGLSAAAAKTPRPTGLYVVLSEKSSDVDSDGSEIGPKTSVINTADGSGVTYQDITVTGEEGAPQPPAELTGGKGTSPTVAQLDAMPTDPVKLRALLLAQALQQQEQAQKIAQQKLGKVHPTQKASVPQPTDDDLVFDSATDMLWEPDLSAGLRSALYKVLAGTSGVVVNDNATDSSGRPAVEISRVDSYGQDEETFMDAATGGTLESYWNYGDGSYGEDLYLSTTYTNTIPADPYTS